MPTAEKTTRSTGAAAAREQVLNMLKEDHKRAKKAFKDFEKLDAEKQPDECKELVEQTCGELQVHTTLEEEIFYPAVRQALKEQDLLDEAEVEHNSAKQLIEQLQTMQQGGQMDGKFAATFTVLGEYVKHHIKEEEGELFEQCEKAGNKVDWAALGEQMAARKAELMEELLPQQTAPLTAGQDEA
ncbi:hemerythrin domain-containing protein [uncultured Azohydromonas sp.]|jgi:Hemerythrin HHE cation binding domain.|uniref:hemerythrin domain-containing protein n=1 Tax=uncultured Azohydromonas sp. TaxID=487342 RepID=UPI00261A29E7|nr:hemerythrin domain-containing protein [uncultured Azohydromonas sp.]